MSLKSFHVFFIAASILLAIGLGIRSLLIFFEEQALSQLAWSLLAFGAALALLIYGWRVLKTPHVVSHL